MRRMTRNITLQCLMIFALVTVWISPACAFISGDMTLIEICGADGLMKVVVPADQVPGNEHGKSQSHDCGFCIAHAVGKALTVPDQAIIDVAYIYEKERAPTVIGRHSFTFDRELTARGPPPSL